jgi:hypothetical protein
MLSPKEAPPGFPLSLADCLPDMVSPSTNSWFPFGVPLEGEWQIPLIRSSCIEDLPASATAFDKRAQADDLAATLLHFYVADRKLRTQLLRPQRFVARFEGAWGLTSPDFTIGAGMPPQDRIQAVWANRAVGAFYQARSLRVIPHVRWCNSRDFEYCFLGVETGSPVAVSTHGCWRSADLRRDFLSGLPVLLERIQPSVLFIHGGIGAEHLQLLEAKTEVVPLEADRTRASRGAA